LSVTFESPVRALSPGQSAVFYLGDRVLGGGIIQVPTTSEKLPVCVETPSAKPLQK
ncbi:MAG: tRNA 2-thiouridine(34) synthase MnmA, partial [Nitrospirota bacterium]|nr:tRNA 2-thiouridine(34) synthase MnmA [Nitrospirota bacterium]